MISNFATNAGSSARYYDIEDQPTDENYYNKGKNFLDAFKNIKFGQDENKYQNQAQQGGFQTGGGDKSSGSHVDKISSDVSIYTPPTQYQPFTVAGTPGKKGFGGVIGQFAGAALGFALGGPAGAGLGSSLGGSLGGAIG
jgi:hypothetical protein